MKKIIALMIILLVLINIIMPVVADGMIRSTYDSSSFKLEEENSQVCAIRYVDGIETMILAINVDKESVKNASKLVWIFPIPSSPEKISADIMRNFPEFYGYNVKKKASILLSDATWFSISTQLLFSPLLIDLFGGVLSSKNESNMPTIYQDIEKYGVKTQIVTASEGKALENYFKELGMSLDDEAKNVLNGYLGKNFSFAVTWISDFKEYFSTTNKEAYSTETLGVKIKFPTDKIFYPLKPTSIYGSLEIPTNIYICEYVQPQFYKQIQNDCETKYFNGYAKVSGDLYNDFFNGYEVDTKYLGDIPQHKYRLKYTNVAINTPSFNFAEDLWFECKVPFIVKVSEHIMGKSEIYFCVLLILAIFLFSLISTLFSGYVFLRKYTNLKTLFLLSFSNFLTTLGHAYLIYFFVLKKLDSNKIEEDFSSQKKHTIEKILEGINILFIGLVIFVMVLLGSYAILIAFSHNAPIVFYPIFIVIFLLLLSVPILIMRMFGVLKYNLPKIKPFSCPQMLIDSRKIKILALYLTSQTLTFFMLAMICKLVISFVWG